MRLDKGVERIQIRINEVLVFTCSKEIKLNELNAGGEFNTQKQQRNVFLFHLVINCDT